METKKCTKCGEVKELGEYYYNKKLLKYISECKSCTNIRNKTYKENNSEKNKEFKKQWHKNNSDKVKENVKKWQENNRDKVNQWAKRWAKNNPEKRAEINKTWQKNNPEKVKKINQKFKNVNREKIKEYEKIYRINNREKIIEKNKNRYNKKRSANYEHIQYSTVFKSNNYICQLCGIICTTPYKHRKTDATLDHIVPLNKGGSHTYDNCQTLCLSCNASKNDRDWNEVQKEYQQRKMQPPCQPAKPANNNYQ